MRVDLTGQRFGKLTVTGEADPIRTPAGKLIQRWYCKCDCGQEKIVYHNALTGKNGTRSCGCSRGDALAIDMTGQRFGRLTVVKRVPLDCIKPNGQRTAWLCKCDCGRETVAQRKDLLSGKLLSCGCLLSETGRKKFVEDNVLGRYDGTVVSAIKPDRPPNKNNQSGVKSFRNTSGKASHRKAFLQKHFRERLLTGKQSFRSTSGKGIPPGAEIVYIFTERR